MDHLPGGVVGLLALLGHFPLVQLYRDTPSLKIYYLGPSSDVFCLSDIKADTPTVNSIGSNFRFHSIALTLLLTFFSCTFTYGVAVPGKYKRFHIIK